MQCTGTAEDLGGGYSFPSGRDQSLNVCGLRPHRMSWAGLGDFQEAIGYCRRQCLVTQLLACSLRLSCFLQCLRTQSHTVTGHAALWLRHITQAFLLCKQCSCRKTGVQSLGCWPKTSLPTGESPAGSTDCNLLLLISGHSLWLYATGLLQRWLYFTAQWTPRHVHSESKMLIKQPSAVILLLPGYCGYCIRWPDFDWTSAFSPRSQTGALGIQEASGYLANVDR